MDELFTSRVGVCVRGTGRLSSEGRWTHAKAEACDEGERGAAPDGNHRDIKRAVFGADLCVNRGGEKSCRQCQPKEREIGTRPSKMGHGPLVVMYPVSLQMKVWSEIDTRKGGMATKRLTLRSRQRHGLPHLCRAVLVRRPS